MSEQAMFDEVRNAVVDIDPDKLMEATRRALAADLDPSAIVEQGLAKGLQIVGKKFEDGEFFLMELATAAEAAKRALVELLDPEIKKKKTEMKSLGRVVLGTVSGDIHDIGKNMVGAMLFAGGFDVHDIGKDVPPEGFLTKAKEIGANAVGASALLTTTMLVQADIVRAFAAANAKDKTKLIFGGAPCTPEWVKEIGGDGYAENAFEAVRVLKQILAVE